jgi:cyclase
MKKDVMTAGAFLMALSFCTAGQTAQKQPPQYKQEGTPPVEAVKISDHVYELRGGSGSNSAFILSDEEVFIIDGKMSEKTAADMLATVQAITDKPITHILLTHSDGDHVNGLTGFPSTLPILAHDNTKSHMAAANEDRDVKLPLPSLTFTDSFTISSGGLVIEMYHFGPAHTDGDAVIYIPADKVAVIGDLYFTGRDPLIHLHKNGSAFGLLKTLKAILNLDVDIYLSGHAEPAGRDDIQALLKSIEEKQIKVEAMIKEGKSLDDIKTAFGLTLTQSRLKSLVEVIHIELTNK